MAAKLTVVYWRDIPTQVIAQQGRTRHSVPLSDRFIKAVDAAAMLGGEIASDDYMSHWRKDVRDCGDDLEQEAKTLAAELEATFDKEKLRLLIKAQGIAANLEAS
jgi:hypothetical protein